MTASDALATRGAEPSARLERSAALGTETRPRLGSAPSRRLLWRFRRSFLRRPRRRSPWPASHRPASRWRCLLHREDSLTPQAAGLPSDVGCTALGAHDLSHPGRHAITRFLASLCTRLPTAAKDPGQLPKTEHSPECSEEYQTPVAIARPACCRTGCRNGCPAGWPPHSSGTSLRSRRPPQASGRSPG